MGLLGPLPWKVMGHILKSWNNDPGPTINLKDLDCINLNGYRISVYPNRTSQKEAVFFLSGSAMFCYAKTI